MVESEEPKNGEEQHPQEPAGDADWLDELATEGSDEWEEDTAKTVESSATLLEPSSEDEIPAWLKADLEKEVASDEDVPDWLVPELANAGAIAASLDKANLSPDSGENELGDDMDQTMLYSPSDSRSSAEPSNILDEEELDWLNQMADDSEVDIEEDPGTELDQESNISDYFENDSGPVADSDAVEEAAVDEQPSKESETTPDHEDQADEKEPLPPGTGQLTWMEDIEAVEEQMRVGEEEVETLPEIVVDNLISAPTEPLSMQDIGEDEEATVFADVPEDPDEAMAWLENLAAKQAAPEEELPLDQEDALQGEQDAKAAETDEVELLSEVEMEEIDQVEVNVAEPVGLEDTLVFVPQAESDDKARSREHFEVTGEGVVEQEIPEDPDEAMAWLEKLAAEKGASDADLDSIEAEFIEPEHEEAIVVEEPIEMELGDSTEADFDFASDLDEALDWLEEMVKFEAGEPSEAVEVVEEPPTPQVVHDVNAAFAEAVVEEEETKSVFSGFEDVIVEGEDLGVTIPSDEVFVEVEVAEEEHKEQSVEPEQAVIEAIDYVASPEVSLTEQEVVEEDDETAQAFAWLDHLAETERDLSEDMAIEGLEEEIPQSTDRASELPVEERSEPSAEEIVEPGADELAEEVEQDLDWLDTLGVDEEQAAEDLVEAEEEIESEELVVSEIPAEEIEETGEEFVSEIEEKLLEEDEAEAVVEEILRDLGQEELGFARSAIEAGEMEKAITSYESLLDDPAVVPFVISDLEAIVDQEGSQVPLQRILGDAYVRNGQLKRALEIYRMALDSL